MAKRIVNLKFDVKWSDYVVVSTSNCMSIKLYGGQDFNLAPHTRVSRQNAKDLVIAAHGVDDLTINIKQ